MDEVLRTLKEMVTLNAKVEGLQRDIDRLTERVEDHHDRILKLESREELLVEKTRTAAVQSVSATTTTYCDRISRVEQDLATLKQEMGGDQQKQLPSQ